MIILKELGAPRQIQNLARKILEPAQVWLPTIGKKGHKSKLECILGQTGVKQGCPISSLLFIIVFNLLLQWLQKNHPLKELSAYMDDLGLIVQEVNEINSLAKTFQEYEEATGVKLNFEKCFVLSTQAFEPKGPWADMPKKNFQSECTVYLGVPISKKIELKREWNPILQKM